MSSGHFFSEQTNRAGGKSFIVQHSLHNWIKELTRKGVKFVRYTDGFSIYTKSKYQIETVWKHSFILE
jgi:hypothetical protein